MGNSPCSVHRRAPGTDERGFAATPPGASGAPGTSTFERTVLLHDWWLIRAKDEWSREGLAVGGLTSTGKAVRIFSSAPIIKRYDAYTLETADGIIVRIQGIINVKCMHRNGFPFEACSHFRIGFPFNWRDYANRYFRMDVKGNNVSTYASDNCDHPMDAADSGSYDFPVCLKEFPVSRIVDCLNSICREIVDSAQKSTDTTRNLSQNNHNNEKISRIVAPAAHNVDGHSSLSAEENVCITTQPASGALETNDVHLEVSDVPKDQSCRAVKNILLHERHHLDEKAVGSDAPTMVTSKETPNEHIDMVDRRMHGEMQSLENRKLSLLHSSTTETGSEGALLESLHNEANDRQLRGSGKMTSSAFDYSSQVGMTMSEPPNKKFSLRRSERLRDLEGSVRTSQKSLENKKRRKNENDSVARRLKFSSQKSFHGCSTTSVQHMLDVEGSDISSNRQEVENIQESLPKSRGRYGHRQMRNNRKENKSVSDIGKIQVLCFSDNPRLVNTETAVRYSNDLTQDRHEADGQNLHMPIREDSISEIRTNCVAEHLKEVRQSDIAVDIQPNDDKSSGRTMKKSMRKPYSIAPITKMPMTRQRTRESFASPELLNLRRSRSGRLLVPTLANWCQQILYDMDGSITGISTGVDATSSNHRGSGPEHHRKKKKVV